MARVTPDPSTEALRKEWGEARDTFGAEYTFGTIAARLVVAGDALAARLSQAEEALQTVREELVALERWGSEQSAGNAFAEQVRFQAITWRKTLDLRFPALAASSAGETDA